MVNEFIGTAIAIMFTAFIILYLTRIAENKYHLSAEHDSSKRSNIMYVGFGFFALMIIGMVLYHYPIPLFDDLRRVAIFGFTVSCLATGFALGYSYIFNGLKQNAETLLFYIESVTKVIHYYSKPIQVNYTTHHQLRSRIYKLQQLMFDLIAGPAELATSIAAGAASVPTVAQQIFIISDRTSLKQTENPPAAQKHQKPPARDEKTKIPSRQRISQLYHQIARVLGKPAARVTQPNHEDLIDQMYISVAEAHYFPLPAIALKELHQRIKSLTERKSELTQEEHNYWHNQGTWQSIGEQLRNNRSEILRLERQIESIWEEGLLEADHLRRMEAKESALLTEGYYTGIWFKDTDPSQQLIVK